AVPPLWAAGLPSIPPLESETGAISPSASDKPATVHPPLQTTILSRWRIPQVHHRATRSRLTQCGPFQLLPSHEMTFLQLKDVGCPLIPRLERKHAPCPPRNFQSAVAEYKCGLRESEPIDLQRLH